MHSAPALPTPTMCPSDTQPHPSDLLVRGAFPDLHATLNRALDRALAHVLEQQFGQLQRATVRRLLTMLELRDPDSAHHSIRVGHLAALLGSALGLPAASCHRLKLAAALHDLGKIALPDGILKKASTLTEREWEAVRRHPQVGADLLGGSSDTLSRLAAEVALSHHERFDGRGYPFGLAGDAIPLSSRIVALADVFDALMNHRIYRPAFPSAEVLAFVRRNRGRHFDPEVVDAFFATLPEVRALDARLRDPTAALAGLLADG